MGPLCLSADSNPFFDCLFAVTPLADYYMLAGVVYQAPDLCSVINSRLVSKKWLDLLTDEAFLKLFAPKISLVIRLTVCYSQIISCKFEEFGIGSTNYPLFVIFTIFILITCLLDIVWRNSLFCWLKIKFCSYFVLPPHISEIFLANSSRNTCNL